MTVIVSKPAVNLREELASLRNQGGYQEQQFYFDGLVTNGTFDSDTSGGRLQWTGLFSGGVLSKACRVREWQSCDPSCNTLWQGNVLTLQFVYTDPRQ